ncbi:MAG: C-GCAxxG-C-C family (seleno)protein [Victivallaceae bacterium]|nr:C-GCAxxG-C-C family (seleno)protein [Victivallaceae bacterium]
MPVKKSIKAYNDEKFNCAQSILKGFQEHFEVSDHDITEARKIGGGRAENGLCGALHSAITLVRDEKKKTFISTNFIEAAGSDKCREIRKINRLKCSACVELAANLLHKETIGTSTDEQ